MCSLPSIRLGRAVPSNAHHRIGLAAMGGQPTAAAGAGGQARAPPHPPEGVAAAAGEAPAPRGVHVAGGGRGRRRAVCGMGVGAGLGIGEQPAPSAGGGPTPGRGRTTAACCAGTCARRSGRRWGRGTRTTGTPAGSPSTRARGWLLARRGPPRGQPPLCWGPGGAVLLQGRGGPRGVDHLCQRRPSWSGLPRMGKATSLLSTAEVSGERAFCIKWPRFLSFLSHHRCR